jgi:hypothetical protein
MVQECLLLLYHVRLFVLGDRLFVLGDRLFVLVVVFEHLLRRVCLLVRRRL